LNLYTKNGDAEGVYQQVDESIKEKIYVASAASLNRIDSYTICNNYDYSESYNPLLIMMYCTV